MKTKYLVSAIAISVLLTGCIVAPVRDDSRVQNSIGLAGARAPRLPAINESYLDDAWFAEPLTVDRAVQAALLNNPQVRAELSRLDAAQAELIQAGLLRNPMGSLMVLRPEGAGRFELDYSLVQSLFDLFTRTKRVDVANASRARTQAEVMLELLRIAQDTEVAYFDAMAIKEALRLQREQLELEENTLLLLKHQAQQGVLSSGPVLAQQAAVSMQAHALRTAEAEQTKALSALAQLLGLSSIHRLELPDHLPALSLAVFNEPELQALALKHRPELMATNASVDQARAEKKLQTGALRATDPSLGLGGIRESGGMSLNGLSAQISLPIFDTGRARSALADAKIAQAQYQVEATRRLIPLEVERALATLIANTKALEHADHHVRQQRQLETLALRNYQQGSGDYMNVVQAKRLRLASQTEQLQAQQILRLSYVDLERVTGVAMQNLSAAP
ncbi:MAG TPA: TolC family protein [Arenimonas sp.]|nr:TolC family protein [Arenimonas sp.]HPW32727.1 TolC family protein [Arenimonas sp.]